MDGVKNSQAEPPCWTDPEMENEDRGKRGRALLFLRRGSFALFCFHAYAFEFCIASFHIVWTMKKTK